MSSRRLVMLLLLASCAGPATVTKDPSPTAERPPSGGDELSKAFDPEPEKPKDVIARPAVPAPVDPAAAFKAALAEGQAALKARQLERARAAAQTAVKEASTLDGDARLQAGQLAFRVEQSAADPLAAEEAATAWQLACGPEKVDACRGAALAALSSVGKLKGADKRLVKRARALQEAEACAAKAERAASPAPCEGPAVRLSPQDLFLTQRVLLGQALRESAEARQVALLEKAEGHCGKPQCAGQRRKALGKLLAIARAKNDTDGAVKLALREVAVIAAGLPEDRRTWARTAMLDQTCVSYDTAHAAGSCRALEKKVLGRWTFHDYSRDPPGQGLSPDQVRTVNEHFAPLLQECLAEQARRMTPPDAQRYEVRWVVFNDGRAGEAHLRKDLDETALAKCLRAQFDGWRYPPYEGEYQHVQQSFTVTAVERRPAR